MLRTISFRLAQVHKTPYTSPGKPPAGAQRMPLPKTSPPPQAKPATWRRVASAVALALAMIAGVVIYQFRRAPDFYRQEVARPAAEQQAASDQFLTNVSATVSQAQRRGAWSTEISEEEVNGWLAFDLPRNHPDLLGDSVHSPRVELEQNRGRLAFEYRGMLNTVVCLEFDAEVRDKHTVAIRLHSLTGGAMPLPLGAVIEEVTNAAEQFDQQIQWTEEEGCPVALITLPEWEDDGKTLSLLDVRLEAGRFLIIGETVEKRSP